METVRRKKINMETIHVAETYQAQLMGTYGMDALDNFYTDHPFVD